MPTSRARKTVLVAGASGRLGAIVDALLARGHSVRAMTRAIDSPTAMRLRQAGAVVVHGDFDDPNSIQAAAADADALFATGTAHRSGPDGEARHGRNLAAAAAGADVAHLVYSSGDGAAPDSQLPLMRAKFEVEEHIRSLGVRHTILAPVYFMENLFNPWNLPDLSAGKLPSPIPIDVPLQQVAITDLVALAIHVIERPAEFAGRRIRIASDELTARQAAAVLSRVGGRHLDAEQLRLDPLPPPLRALFAWLEQVGHDVDIAALRRTYPEITWTSYAGWARSQRARLRDSCPQPAPAHR